ncbi:MAG: aminomethyl-transferring glycine dehydrogenase [Tistrella sp.]|uniref:Probable glycine dehydrogenase (decarboxylating) subunit 1 n=1 Tax=Tistrella mobilis TaxID=171437 RepID=A0A3B9ISA8_9PROT|nr:aminomethyl-transferring glycine dehydrogenase subunit GcvPA [Tistrella sp.]MAD35651.1 aminomethyl-transferring glycine dehydrogenase [Tistrella sp.]MBA76198.1 aminomethyl-transferring glycine dehydrogenase [Tistrella sp.]HAE50742.1 aminomethyl-transferring glycine dehydrogenase subunit GcvPA [Tistrella mobilis]
MRYLPLTGEDRAEMLRVIGAPSIDALYSDVPADLLHGPEAFRAVAPGKSELQVEREMAAYARASRAAGDGPFFVGGGLYRHHVPAAVDHLIQRSEFLTAYTPYQPEIAQGTLQTLFEFQTQVALLTGMDVANASLYDGSTAAAEAGMMAVRITRRNKVVVAGSVHPHYRAVVQNQLGFAGIEVDLAPADPTAEDDVAARVDAGTAAVIVQNPGFFGQVRDLTALAQAVHAKGALLIVAVTEAVSLGAVESPGAMGADIVVGEGQSFGNALTFGGPTVGLFATRSKFLRQMPGRLCGETVDADGRRGFVLTLSTREQHIRRDKATSNICTSAGLCASAFTIHLAMLGEQGLTHLAALNHALAGRAADRLAAVPGLSLVNDTFFNEFTLDLGRPAAPVVERLAARGILAGIAPAVLDGVEADAAALQNLLVVAVTELVTDEDVEALASALTEELSA